MFSSKRSEISSNSMQEHHGSASGATIIARGVRVQGDFSSQGDVVIDGVVEGNVSTTGQLTIGQEAKLKADVTANDAIVSGLIEGTLTVKRRLDLKSTGRVMGDVTCEAASVEAGAVVHGKVAIGAKTATAAGETKKAAAVEA